MRPHYVYPCWNLQQFIMQRLNLTAALLRLSTIRINSFAEVYRADSRCLTLFLRLKTLPNTRKMFQTVFMPTYHISLFLLSRRAHKVSNMTNTHPQISFNFDDITALRDSRERLSRPRGPVLFYHPSAQISLCPPTRLSCNFIKGLYRSMLPKYPSREC